MPPDKITPKKKDDSVDPSIDSDMLSGEQNLRRQAEMKLNELKKKTGPLPAMDADMRRLVYELEVHQVELEMQNEELMQARGKLEATLDQYTDLYDFAPVGYFTMARDGTIHQVNLTGANLLGVGRGSLIRRRFGLFVSDEFRASFIDFLEKLFECREKGNGEFTLKRDGLEPLWVQIEASCLEDGQMCRAVVVDITEAKRVENEIHRQAKELASLQELVLEIAAPQDLPTLLHTIVQTAAQMLDARGGGLYLSDSNQRQVRCVVSYNTVRDYTGTILEYGEGAAGTVAQTREPLIIDDYRAWSNQAAAFLEEQPFTAVLSVPMIWHDELIGVIHILDDVENRRFTETDQTLLTLIANHAAVAVKNTHLYEGAQQEIAERVQAEDALRRSEERYRTLIHQIPSIVYLDDATTDPPQTQYISPYVKEMLGYTPEEWLEGGFGFWMALIYPEDRERVSNTYLSSLEREGTLNIEYRLYSKTRQIIWVQDQANVLRDESGKSRTIHGVIHNITEIKQAEQALQESKSTLQAALSSMADAVFISNADGQKLEFNDAFVSFHKFKNRAECSKWLSDYPDILDVFLANGELAPLEMWAIPRALRGETVTDAEYTLRRKDTGETWMGSYNFAPIRTKEGEIVGSVVVAHDITERKQAEKRLRQSRRQLRALTNYQQTAIENERAHIARELHDQFGQLLAGLKMDLSWLARHLEANSERQERFQSMNGLIDEAIDVTRRIASELRPGLLDDLGLFPALEWLISEFERRSDISCTLSLPPEEPDLESDLNTALFRIFQECLTNVSRHAQASRVEARLTVSNDELHMELTDNGRGISKSESQHVNSFGLLGMQERVAQWGGTLQITGKEGKGTTVMVKIPLPAFRQKDVL